MRILIYETKQMKLRFLTVFLFAMTTVSLGQELDSVKTRLYEDFSEVYTNESFDIGKEIKTRIMSNDEIYFLIKVIPKKEGVHFIKQITENDSESLYRFNTILNVIRASKKGISRVFIGKGPSPYFSSKC